jgi:hypothetical protein
MRLGKLTALTGVMIISIAVIFGCSSDKSTPTGGTTYGSIDDPEFVPVKEQIDNTVTTLIEDILAGFNNLYVAPGDTSSVQNLLTPPATQPDPEADPDVLITIYENGWHFVYATYTGDVYYAEIGDSIQFRVDGVPVREPGTNVDYIHYIDNWQFTALDQEVTHIDFEGRNEFQIANLDQNVAVINGSTWTTVETNYMGLDTSMTNLFAFDVTIADINVPKVVGQWVTACPLSGTVTMDLSDTFEWTGPQSSGNGSIDWTVNVVFDDGNATVTATNGNDNWRYTCEVCVVPSE